MGMLKRRQISSGRSPLLSGLDFSHIETQNAGFLASPGTTIKFLGGTTMGFDHATRGGIRITGIRDDEYAHTLALYDSITCSKESRQGTLYMYSERPATDPCTTGWGGGEDQLLNLTLRNYAVNTGGMGMRGLNMELRQRSGGTCTNMYGLMVTLNTDSGTTTSGAAYAGRFVTKFNGIHTGEGEQWALEAADESQTADQPAGVTHGLLRLEKQANSNTLDTPVGLKIDNNAAAKAITYGIFYEGTVTNVLAFAEADGSQGFTAGSGLSQGGNIDGYIRVYDVTTGQALYIGCYDAAPA